MTVLVKALPDKVPPKYCRHADSSVLRMDQSYLCAPEDPTILKHLAKVLNDSNTSDGSRQKVAVRSDRSLAMIG